MKTGGEYISLVSSSLTASAFIKRSWSRGPVATTSGLHPGNDGSCPSGITQYECSGTPIGRAAWLKPKRLRVRIPPCAIHETRLSRQLADHLGLEPGMLWVRIPPELFTSRPRGAARSARHPVKVEIRGSNPLGDAFSQHTTTRYAIWKSGVDQPASMPVGARNLRDFVGSTPIRVTQLICVG